MKEIELDIVSQQAAEIAALHLENKALSSQVMRLIKAESKLYEYQEQFDVQLKEYKELYELNRKLNATFDLGTIFENAIGYIINILGYERVIFLKQIENSDDYAVSAIDGYYDQLEKSTVAELVVSREEFFLSSLFEGEEYLICMADSDQKKLAEYRTKLHLNEFLLFPLGSHVHPVAILVVGNSTDNAEFYRRVNNKDDSLLSVGNLVGLLSSTIENQISYANMKKALEQERLAEAKYRGIFENSIEGIYQSSPDGRIINCNPATASILGYSSPEQVTACVFDIGQQFYVNPQQRGELLHMMHDGLDVKNFEVEFHRIDGSRQWMCLNCRPFFNERGELLHLDGNIQDITERKNLEKQLQHSQKMEAVGTLAGGVAHDFNNILTAIIGYGNLVQMQMTENNPSKAHLDALLVAADRATNLTRSLLAFSRKQDVELKPVNLNDVVLDAEKILRRLIREDIELKTSLSSDELTVMADIGQLEQVLMNFAANSRDAILGTGSVSISIEMTVLDLEFRNLHSYGEPGRYALLTYSDTGTGMEENTRQRIFEPFFTTKEVGKGTGLGLSIVYGIIKQHKGYIYCYSELGRGTTFRIYLPIINAHTVKTGGESNVPLPTGTETILLAEDDELVRNLIRALLEKFGYRVINASNGEEAVSLYAEHQDEISLVLLDVIMPRMNGREAYRQIQQLTNGIKVIFTSGYTADLFRKEEIYDTETAFLSKPLSPKELLVTIRKLLDR